MYVYFLRRIRKPRKDNLHHVRDRVRRMSKLVPHIRREEVNRPQVHQVESETSTCDVSNPVVENM